MSNESMPIYGFHEIPYVFIDKNLEALATDKKPMILEVGSSQHPHLQMFADRAEVHYLDIDPRAVEALKAEGKVGICADALSADIPDKTYDIVWSSYLLEHVKEAETVVDNMVRWTKPAGLCIVRIPDPNSLHGSVSKRLPTKLKSAILRLLGEKTAGMPGYRPWPTYFSPIVSPEALIRYCQQNGHAIELSFSDHITAPPLKISPVIWKLMALIWSLIILQRVDSGRGNFIIGFRKKLTS